MIYTRLLLALMLFGLGESQDGVFTVAKITQKKNGSKVLRAKCVYTINEPLPGISFDIAFNMATSSFQSTKVSEVNKVGNTYEVANTVSVAPTRFIGSFSVAFTGDTHPVATCSSLRIVIPNKFEGSVLRTWNENGLTRFDAECKFDVDQTYKPKTMNFLVEFDTVVSRFKHWTMKNIAPTGDSGRWFHMTNRHWMHPTMLSLSFQGSYDGDTKPKITCSSDLPTAATTDATKEPTTEPTAEPTTEATTTVKETTQKTTEATTIKPTSEVIQTRPDLPFTFPGSIKESWQVNGFTRLNGYCKYAVDSSYQPETQSFLIDFGVDVEQFVSWVGVKVNPLTDSGSWFLLSNKYWIHPSELEFNFQASYSGSIKPTITCGGTLPPYELTTQGPVETTQGPVETTQGPVETTQGPVETTQGPVETTQGPVETTQGPVKTTQGPVTTTQGPQTTTEAPVKTTKSPRTTTLPPDGSYNYNEVLMKSIWFYRAQRSGALPVEADDPVPWRGDSALYDGEDVGRDLTGGWYDAGDWVKFNFPISSATAVLGWGLVQWKDAYIASGQYENMLDSIKWSLDFFLKCWDPANEELYGQVGNGNTDHSKMMRAEDMTPSNMPRPAYKVTSAQGGSDLAGSIVAAFATGAIAFQDEDPAYSSLLLESAESLYSFANTYRALYTGEISDAGSFYPSSGYKDELVYAAAMLYKATGNANYLEDAEKKYNEFGFDYQTSWAFDWSDKLMGAKLLLYEATSNQKYMRDVQKFLREWSPQGNVQYTKGGLAWRAKWGSLRYSANTAFIALMASDLGIDATDNVQWAQSQIHYMLGDNPRAASYVVGFGNSPPKQPHHKSSTCAPEPATCDWSVFSNTSSDNYYTLYGALVGGPDASDSYVDKRTDYIMAEVTCDYNAGFQSAVAGLIHFKNN